MSNKNTKKELNNLKKTIENAPNNTKVKNYLILFLLVVVTVTLTLYLCDCYRVYSDNQKEIPVIRGTLSEITYEELDHYIMENPNSTIYMCTASSQNCRNFENDFIKLIKKKDLQDDIIYLNLSGVDETAFLTDFNNKYKYKYVLTTEYPAIVTFDNSNVANMLQEKDGKLSITKVKHYIELNKIGE